MKIGAVDCLLLRLAESAGGVLHTLGNLETEWLRRRLHDVTIESPVFIAGLARSGTTILLEELSKVPGFGTHRYRDFPFVMTPWIWNRFLDRFQTAQPGRERPHQDGIRITPESPEAYEEPIWQHFFPDVHDPRKLHRLTSARRHRDFDAFFADHIRKLLLVRRARRYLSKGNYNVARIEYLATLFPDARFIVPIRHPFAHVRSLMRQHALFCDYARRDPRVARWLAAAGHYEFGPQRIPIRIESDSGDGIQAEWDAGHEAAGYARQWAEIYRFVDALRSGPQSLANRILLVRHEDLCAQPFEVMQRILRHISIDPGLLETLPLDHIAAPAVETKPRSEEFLTCVWQQTASVARRFGYAWTEEASEISVPQCDIPTGDVSRSENDYFRGFASGNDSTPAGRSTSGVCLPPDNSCTRCCR